MVAKKLTNTETLLATLVDTIGQTNSRLAKLEAERESDLEARIRQMQSNPKPLIGTKPAAAKQERRILEPVAPPEFQFEISEGKYGPALNMTFEGRRTSRWVYASEMEILIRHLPEIQAALKKISK
jgi:hypothetical protein